MSNTATLEIQILFEFLFINKKVCLLYLSLDIDYYACVPNKNDGAECPAGFVRHGDECHKSWRPIGYQNVQYGSALTANCRTDECNVDVDGNFLNLGDHDTFKIRFRSWWNLF